MREYVDPSDRTDINSKGEQIDPDDPSAAGGDWRTNYVTWRHWTATESVLYNYAGDEVLARIPHRFGRVPIVRLIDLKKHRTPNVGKSRYEYIAALQRDYYNRDSEMILSDTLQAHPFLSGPEDFCKADNTLSVGPGYLLPKKKNSENGSYEGFDYVSPPKDPAESLRKNLDRIIDLKDRNACLIKPAGAAGTTGSSVSQSGVSKEMDAETGGKLLSSIAKSLARAETILAEYALLTLRHRPVTPEDRRDDPRDISREVRVAIGGRADRRHDEASARHRQLRRSAQYRARADPGDDQAVAPGTSDAEYKALDSEVELLVKTKARLKEQMREMNIGIGLSADAFDGDGSPKTGAGTDPTGEIWHHGRRETIPAVS